MSEQNDDYDFTIMLEEAQNYFNAQIRSFDIFRDHGKTILGTSSILVSLFAVFGVTNISSKGTIFYIVAVILIAILYGILMFKSLLASVPKTFHYPIEPSEKEYAKAFLNKSRKDIIKQRIANYLDIIEKNEIYIKERRELAKEITVLLIVIVVFILIVSLFPLIL